MLRSTTGGEVEGFAGDLSVAASAEQLVRDYPGVQILVNNLGIFEPKPFEDIPDADWVRFFEVNVLSGIRLARLLLPAMRRANWGRIIFISSESGVQIPAEMIQYGSPRPHSWRYREGWRRPSPVRPSQSTASCPALRSPAVSATLSRPWPRRAGSRPRNSRRSFSRRYGPASLIKRFAEPEEVASLVAYIASPLASATTGAALRVDGGVIRSAF